MPPGAPSGMGAARTAAYPVAASTEITTLSVDPGAGRLIEPVTASVVLFTTSTDVPVLLTASVSCRLFDNTIIPGAKALVLGVMSFACRSFRASTTISAEEAAPAVTSCETNARNFRPEVDPDEEGEDDEFL